MEKRCPINFRAFLVIALFVTAAVLAAYAYALNKIAGICSGIGVISGAVAAFAVALVRFIRKQTKLRKVICFGIAALLCVSAFSIGCGYADMRADVMKYSGMREVYGRICAVYTGSGEYEFCLDKLEIDGVSVSGKLSLGVSTDDFNTLGSLECGDTLHFDAYITVSDLISDGVIDGYSYRTGIYYHARVRAENVAATMGNTLPLKSFLRAINVLLVENMGSVHGNIAFSMLTGDKNGLGSDIADYFSAAGLGHIMAVSGLHIGFFVTVLNFVLSRVDKRIRYPLITAVLFAYTVVADFSPSVVRAFVMTALTFAAFFVGGRRDMLNAMCCAMSLILAFAPFYLFEAGFILSFGAIYGIALFSDSIRRAMNRIKVNDKISNAIGSSTSVQAGIIPAQIFIFGKMQPFAVILNMFMIPYISVVFIAVLCSMPIAAIPGCGAVLKLGMYLLMPLDYIARAFANIPFGEIAVSSTPAVLLCYPLMFFASDCFMMPKGKLSVVLATVVACAVCTFLNTTPKTETNFIGVPDTVTTETVISYENETYIIGYVGDLRAVYKVLERKGIRKIDGIYLLGNRESTLDNILYLSGRFEIGTVYCYEVGDFGMRFIDNGVDFRLADENCTIKPALMAGEPIGYEYLGILFAIDGADEIGHLPYSVVRARSVEYVRDGITYLCNECDSAGVYTLENGEYYIDIENLCTSSCGNLAATGC